MMASQFKTLKGGGAPSHLVMNEAFKWTIHAIYLFESLKQIASNKSSGNHPNE